MERSKTGVIRHARETFGKSVEGNALTVWIPESHQSEILVLASIHGDEAETTVALSEALRSIRREDLRSAAILCGNPDGLLRGTRGNANGVDLNRNLPTATWSPETVRYKSREGDPRDIELSPGTHAGSEPETAALLALIERLKPKAVVTLHAALACIDDATGSVLGQGLAERTGLPLQVGVGFPTPGSLGTWAEEQGLNLVTYEFEAAPPSELKDRHVPILADVLKGNIRL